MTSEKDAKSATSVERVVLMAVSWATRVDCVEVKDEFKVKVNWFDPSESLSIIC